mmetsp:Transcript_38847/g.50858  ORF Transcript_38847/g.50858 Transcript_38847/m.50858 type:complete len:102 (+) Transcript_38847:301-606(+)
MMKRLEPTHEFPVTQRLLCSSTTIIREETLKAPVKKAKVKKQAVAKGAAKGAAAASAAKDKKGAKGGAKGGMLEKSKKIKKRKKMSKDERRILQMQKKGGK